METKVDPLKVLDLPKNYNKEMLREAYKRMALKAHPDKGGNEYLFKLLTQCYKYLSAELKKKEADKQFYELKKEFQNVIGGASHKETKTSRTSSKPQGVFYEGERFDKDKFNKYFEDNKFKDEVYEAGYKEWMEKHNVKEAPQYRGSFNSSGFNNHFEKHAKISSQNKQIMKYQEPEALVAVKRLGFTELGQDSIDDFSGENKSIKHLNYMDYKVAHTTNRIIDPSTVKRQGFNNIQELENARENVAYQMTEQEIVELMKKQRLQQKMEEQRQANLNAYDKKVSQHYERLNGLLQMPQYR